MLADEHPVLVPTRGGIVLKGALAVPEGAQGIVVFAQAGSVSREHAGAARSLAKLLRVRSHLATLRVDLFTLGECEEARASMRPIPSDVAVGSERLIGAVHWLRREPPTNTLAVGCLGTNTGAAAALVAAAGHPDGIRAIVAGAGRPELAAHALPSVQAPTLFVVPEDDDAVVAVHREALERLGCEKELAILPTLPFEDDEDGLLPFADVASGWFLHHFSPRPDAEELEPGEPTVHVTLF